MALLRAIMGGTSRRGFAGAWPILAMGILVAAVLTALIGFELWRERAETQEQTYRETRNLTALLGQNVAQAMKSASEMQQAFADRGRVVLANRGFDTPEFRTELTLLPQGLPQVAGMFLTDATGRTVVSTLPGVSPGDDVSNQDYFRSAVAARPNSTEPLTGTLLRDEQTSRWFIPLSSPIHDEKGTLLGGAIVMVDPQVLVGPFEVLNIGRFSAVTLMQNDGIIVARLPDEGRFVGRTIAGGELDRRLASQADGSMRVKGVLYGRDLFMSYRQVAGTPYIVNVAFDANQVLLPWVRLASLYAVLGLALIVGVVVMVRLVHQSESRRAELGAARQFRDIIEGVATQVALLEPDGTIVEVNRALLKSGGAARHDVVGWKLWETAWHAHSDASQQQVRSALARAVTGEIVRGDFNLRTGAEGGSFAIADMTFQSIRESGSGRTRVIASAIDVTERRRLELQLVQSQKLEAIGLLAGGIAHDFNNILGAIANFAALLIDDLKGRASEHSYAVRIAKACDHGKQVVTQLLAYARPAESERTATDVRDMLKEVEMLVRPSLPASAVLLVDAGSKPVSVMANRAQLTQIFVNLCLNARDALPQRQGTVRVGLSLVEPPDPRHPAHLAETARATSDFALRRAGQPDPSRVYARISVADDGEGMNSETLSRVFEPFFTTKSRGEGTGLGLAIVDTTVLSLHGCYSVESRLGRGTEFAVCLPVEEGAAMPASAAKNRPARRLENIRILIVDDDLDAAESAAMVLTRAGCEVSVTDDPLEALATITEDPQAWDAVVSDETMPHMKGTELIAKIKARLPDFPIVLCTGSASFTDAAARAKGADGYVAKPADPERLVEAVAHAKERAGVH